MPLITKDAPEVAVDRGDEQCALDRCESNASRRCGCARELGCCTSAANPVPRLGRTGFEIGNSRFGSPREPLHCGRSGAAV